MSMPTLTIEQLLAARHPADVSLSPDGGQLAVVVADGASEPGRAPAARLWLGPLGGTLRQVTELDCTDGVPRWSPSGAELAIASDREHSGRMSLYVIDLAAGKAEPLGQLAGSVEEIAWAADGSSLIVLAADLGLDTAGALNAVLIGDAAQAAPDPVVLPGPPARRRLYQVGRASGATREIDLGGLNAWDFSWDGAGTLAAIVSAGSGESDWYTAAIAVYQLAGGARQVAGYQPRWQLGVPRLAPGGQRLAFLEGVCSDRGILAGELMVADIAPGDLAPRPLGPDNVKYLEWRDGESLLYAAADGARSLIGTAGTGGGAVVWRGDVTLGDGYHVRTSSDAAGRQVVAVTEGASGPPEVACLPLGGDAPAAWTPVTDFNTGLTAGPPPSWEAVTWTSDEHQIEGLLVLPPGRAAERLPLVVLLHGGPTWGWGYQWSNADFPVLWAAAGYAVLMPNPRGSAGYGQAFARANIHDMGGGELRDVLAGVDMLIERGIADERRLGVTGASHGGYLANWAITQTGRFAAAIPVAAPSNRLSKHNTGNNGYVEELFYDRDPYDVTGRVLSRSPIVHVRQVRTPTLIIHGEKDRCVPVSQAYEMYHGLARLGTVPVELVVYPREGHSISERGHLIDLWQRSRAWFDRYVASAGG